MKLPPRPSLQDIQERFQTLLIAASASFMYERKTVPSVQRDDEGAWLEDSGEPVPQGHRPTIRRNLKPWRKFTQHPARATKLCIVFRDDQWVIEARLR